MLKARLGFLMFALTNSSLCLTEAHVDQIWRVLVEGALTPQAAGEGGTKINKIKITF